MTTTLELEPLLVLREHPSGILYAYPFADPTLRCRAHSEDDVIATQERFLGKYLSKVPADRLADFVLPEDVELLELPITIPRADLSRRIQMTEPITVPCVSVPDRGGAWVHVLPLFHTLFVPKGEDRDRRVRDEIERYAAARELDGHEFRKILPVRSVRLVRARVRVERADHADLSRREASRRRREGKRADEQARKLLGDIGSPLIVGKATAPVIGREREIRSLAALLSGRERLAVMLVGPEMAGKTAVVLGLASSASVPFRHLVIATSGSQLVAGQSGFGQLQERVEEVMRAAAQVDAILYFDNLADLFAGTSGGIEDLASVMRPYLADGRVRVVGELTPELAEHYENRHVGFFSCLHRVAISPLDAKATRTLLARRVAHTARTEPNRPNLDRSAIDPLVELADRYLSYRSFPGKAVRFYEELRAIHESDMNEDGTTYAIGAYDVYRAFSVRSGIPIFLLRDEQALKYEEIVAAFAKRLIGQREAIRRVAETLCTVKAELQPPAKPLANFLFIGPTGVGKTELAKTLARFLFGSADRMVRFDMSEYMDPFAAERLIRGTDRDEGELTRKVRQQPFCVVLLDEIEKAHHAVFDLLLQVCGEGRLSDARGKTTYFHNAIIIMTSNLGAAHRRPQPGFGDHRGAADPSADDRHYIEQVERHFRPEFVNRLDRVIPFHALSSDEIGEVAGVLLARLGERQGLLNRAVDLRASPGAIAALAAGGFSDAYGARALRRYIEDTLVAPLAGALSELGSFAEGAQVRVVAGGEADEAAGAADGAERRELVSAGISIAVYRPAARRSRQALSTLEKIAKLRRMAAAAMQLGAIEDIRERVDYLVSEMASGQRKRKRADTMALATQATEHTYLTALLKAADEHVEAIANAEELAMAGLEEGEPTDIYLDEAERSFAAFERAFVRVVLGAKPDDRTALFVRPLDDPELIRTWLLGFLAGAKARDWRVEVHRLEDRDLDGSWPTDIPWGPPRDSAWVRSELESASEDALAKHWRALLVRAKGPFVGSLMQFELGLQRWLPSKDGNRASHLEIKRLSGRFAFKPADLRSAAYAPPPRDDLEKLANLPAVRLFRPDGSFWLANSGEHFSAKVAKRYWLDLDRILFGPIAGVLARGDDVTELAE